MAPRKHSIGPASAADRAVSSGVVVIYARYSSHAQRDASIEQQIEKCTAFAKRNSLFILETYADKTVSGKTDRRKAFQRMLTNERYTGVCLYRSVRKEGGIPQIIGRDKMACRPKQLEDRKEPGRRPTAFQ